MQRLLPLIVLLLSWIPLCQAAPKTCPRNAISNLPECLANAVFGGKDRDMPIGDDYEMALEPLRDKNGKSIVPHTIPDALEHMRKILPHWYLNALRRSRGDNECSVTINRSSYATLVTVWFFTQWELDREDSPLRRQFESIGIRTGDEIEQALEWGLCGLVKHDEKEALEIIKQRGAAGKAIQ